MEHSSWTRKLCMVLAIVLITMLVAPCGLVSQKAYAETSSTEELSDNEWLAENLENLKQSLLSGNFAEVLKALLAHKKGLINDAQYNALLYIAYVLNGETEKAYDLLFNTSLNLDKFVERVTSYLKEFPTLKDTLATHMLKLSESNPKAYSAIVSFASVMKNNDPSDPTAYAIRFIAALTTGNNADVDAILQDAKNHGISAEALQTTSVEYLEKYGATIVTVDQVEKGISTSTVYNAYGIATKQEAVITDGVYEYLYVKDPYDNVVYSKVTKDATTGKIVRREQYIYDMNLGATTLLNSLVISYKNGQPETITSYNASGEKESYTIFNDDGSVKAVYKYVGGIEEVLPDEQINYKNYEFDEDGNFIKMNTLILDENGNLTGYRVLHYDYTQRGEGLLDVYYTYDINDKLTKSTECNYKDSQENGKKILVSNTHTVYDENGKLVSTVVRNYETNTGTATFSDHTAEFKLNEKGKIIEYYVYDLEHNLKSSTVYGEDGGNTFTTYDAHENITKIIKEDSDGNVIYKRTYTYEYKQNGNIASKYEYDENNKLVSYSSYSYDSSGNITKINCDNKYNIINIEYTCTGKKDGINLKYVYLYDKYYNPLEGTAYRIGDNSLYCKSNYNYNGNVLVSQVDCYYDETGSHIIREENYAYDSSWNQIPTSYTIYEYSDGRQESGKVYSYDENGVASLTQKISYTYDEGGSLVSSVSYAVDSEGNAKYVDENNNPIASEQIVYSYDASGTETGSIVYTYNKDGSVTSETAYVKNDSGENVLCESTEYVYNGDGSYIKTEKDADGNITAETSYDAEGNVIEPELAALSEEEETDEGENVSDNEGGEENKSVEGSQNATDNEAGEGNEPVEGTENMKSGENQGNVAPTNEEVGNNAPSSDGENSSENSSEGNAAVA